MKSFSRQIPKLLLLVVFLLFSSTIFGKTAESGTTKIFGELVKWLASAWKDIQLVGTFGGIIAIGWFAFNQMADHETSRTMVKIGGVIVVILAIWFIEPTIQAMGGNVISSEYIQMVNLK